MKLQFDSAMFGISVKVADKIAMLQNRNAVLEAQVEVLKTPCPQASRRKAAKALQTVTDENERLRMIVYSQRQMIRELEEEVKLYTTDWNR